LLSPPRRCRLATYSSRSGIGPIGKGIENRELLASVCDYAMADIFLYDQLLFRRGGLGPPIPYERPPPSRFEAAARSVSQTNPERTVRADRWLWTDCAARLSVFEICHMHARIFNRIMMSLVGSPRRVTFVIRACYVCVPTCDPDLIEVVQTEADILRWPY